MSQAPTTVDPGPGFGRLSFLAVGHVTIDVLPGGERRGGGTGLYAALQASRLGLSAKIVTRGREGELRELLAPFLDEVELIVQPAPATTTLETKGSGEERRQRMLAWAGPIEPEALPAASILHLAPVAAELPARPAGAWQFIGLTPQGLARRWLPPGWEVEQTDLPDAALALFDRCDAVVLTRQERAACERGLERARREGALVAVTAGTEETVLLTGPEAAPVRIAVHPVARPPDDLGAGDVYAATLFVALCEGAAPERAATLAAAAAALRLAGSGPPAVARRPEIEAQAASAASSSSVSSAAST